MAPRCGQPSWDYWSGADVSISSRHRHALSQPPTITRSPFFPGPGFLSCPPTTNPPSVQTLTDLSDDGFIGSLSLPLPCETRTGLFFFFLHAPSSRPPLIPPRNLHHKKKSLPPPPHIPLPSSPIVDCFTFCYPSAFSLSASSWFVLLPATSKENQGSQSHRHGI